MIKEYFVPLAIRSWEQYRKDSDGEFVRRCGLQLSNAGGNTAVVTAGGKQLGMTPSSDCDLLKAWREWKSLPASERAPGAVQVGERGPIDMLRASPEPPPGGLILKLYYRTLTHDAGKELRHARKQDFVRNYGLGGDPTNPNVVASVDVVIANQAFYEANPDFMWLTEPEWKSLLPAQPTKGEVSPVPAAITERLFRFHLVPTMAYGEAIGWAKKDIRAGKLDRVVEEVGQDRVRLRLEGYALLGPDYETVAKKVQAKGRAWGYEPHLLGHLEYQPSTGKITRFDLVALGDTYGKLQEGLLYFYRPEREPLGVAFEMVSCDVPANRVSPRAAAGGEFSRQYFATGR
jgi:hypothetical protein